MFNVDQVDGLEAPAEEELPELEPIAAAEAIVQGWSTRPRIQTGGDSAFYSPTLDYVQMPPAGAFHTPAGYYSTLFHELTHSTGHSSRLNRGLDARLAPFGSPDYSREELVAEIGAAFLSGHAGIELELINQHAAYIESWRSKLSSDRKLIVQAAGAAQKAATLILGTANGEEEA